jgi:hypothetical protein
LWTPGTKCRRRDGTTAGGREVSKSRYWGTKGLCPFSPFSPLPPITAHCRPLCPLCAHCAHYGPLWPIMPIMPIMARCAVCPLCALLPVMRLWPAPYQIPRRFFVCLFRFTPRGWVAEWRYRHARHRSSHQAHQESQSAQDLDPPAASRSFLGSTSLPNSWTQPTISWRGDTCISSSSVGTVPPCLVKS